MPSPRMTMGTSLKTHRIDGAVDFRLVSQSRDLLVQWGVLRQIGDFKSLSLGMHQTHGVDVTNNHHRCSQQPGGYR